MHNKVLILDFGSQYTQLIAAGEIDRINPVLLEHMKAKGVYNRKNIQQIIDKQGSVQHVDWLGQ